MTQPALLHCKHRSNTLKLWLLVADAEAAKVAQSVLDTAQVAGPILMLETRIASVRHQGAAKKEVERAVVDVHAVTAVELAVSFGPVGVEERAAHPADVVAALGRAIRSAGRYAPRTAAPPPYTEGVTVSDLLLLGARREILAGLVAVALDALVANAKGASREVVDDLLQEKLPELVGVDFHTDIVLRAALARARGLGVDSIPMGAAFDHEVQRTMRAYERRGHAPRWASPWTSVDAVRSAMRGEQWQSLGEGLVESSPLHRATLLALTEAERRTLAQHARCALAMGNVGAVLAQERRYTEAMTVFDAALTNDHLPAQLLSGPLYVVQDDNNHLGIDVARSRRYLERCLRGNAGDANPNILLNAAFVCAEIGDHDQAMALLERVKGAIDVTQYRNERLLVPLRARRDFIRLMSGRRRG